MFIYREKVTSIASCSSWQSHCQILENVSQLAKTSFLFVTSSCQLYLFSVNSNITYTFRIAGKRASYNQLLSTECAPLSIAKVVQSQYLPQQKTSKIIEERGVDAVCEQHETVQGP